MKIPKLVIEIVVWLAEKIASVAKFISPMVPNFVSLRNFMVLVVVAILANTVFLHVMTLKEAVIDRYIKPFFKIIIPVSVATVEKKDVPIKLDYVGSTSAIKTVDLRARVEGFLEERYFVEGDDVKEGDLMYVIEREPYIAALDAAKAQLAQDEASFKFATEQVERYRPLAKSKFVSREAFDNYVTEADEARASVEKDKANIDQAELNLGYCMVYAPISGRIGKTYVNAGNLVLSSQNTLLATIVMLDPIYVYFSPSDDDYRTIISNKGDSGQNVSLSFKDGTVYAHTGTVDFTNNVVDKATSTVMMRAIVPNPEKLLLPNIYLTAELSAGIQKDALVIPEKAFFPIQGGKAVYVVNKNDIAEQKQIETKTSVDGMAIITKGLDIGETVVTEGIVKIKNNSKVKPVKE